MKYIVISKCVGFASRDGNNISDTSWNLDTFTAT